MVLFPLHPPILEPDFDLPLREAEGVCDFYPPSPGQVAVEVELLLELEDLVTGVGRSGPFVISVEHTAVVILLR